MIIDTLNTFHWKRELSGNVSSDVMITSGDADPNLWLVVRVDKALTGTALINVYTSDTENIANPVSDVYTLINAVPVNALINVYTSDTENIANPVLLHGITLPANAPAGYEYKVRLANGVKRYTRANVNNATAGTISVFLTSGITSK